MNHLDRLNRTPSWCQSQWPVTGHQCELEPGHAGEHQRIMSSDWLSWCDAHGAGQLPVETGCGQLGCDLRDAPAPRRDCCGAIDTGGTCTCTVAADRAHAATCTNPVCGHCR